MKQKLIVKLLILLLIEYIPHDIKNLLLHLIIIN